MDNRKKGQNVLEWLENDLLQLDEQSIGLLEIARIEAFAEAAIDGCKNVARLGTFALIDPKPCQVGGGAKFERSSPLAAGRSQSLVEQGLHLGIPCAPHEQRAGL